MQMINKSLKQKAIKNIILKLFQKLLVLKLRNSSYLLKNRLLFCKNQKLALFLTITHLYTFLSSYLIASTYLYIHNFMMRFFLCIFCVYVYLGGLGTVETSQAQDDLLLLGVLEDTPAYLVGFEYAKGEQQYLHLRFCLPTEVGTAALLDSLATADSEAIVINAWQADFIRYYVLDSELLQVDLPLPMQARRSSDAEVAFRQEWLLTSNSDCTSAFLKRFATRNVGLDYRYSVQKIYLERGYLMSFPSADALIEAALGDKTLKIGKNQFEFVPYIHSQYKEEQLYPVFLISQWQ
jgi:hypothetical protein